MSLSEFEFIDPFPKTFQILKCRVNLPHEEIAQWCKDMLAGFNGDYTSYHFMELNDHKLNHRADWYPEFSAMAIGAAELFLENIGVPVDPNKDKNFGAWWSVYKEGDRHILHTHPKCLVAGTYYPYASESSSAIRYRSPMGTLLTMADPRKEEQVVWHVNRPETGTMNLWSPWLEHEVLPQKKIEEGEERVAISFNYG